MSWRGGGGGGGGSGGGGIDAPTSISRQTDEFIRGGAYTTPLGGILHRWSQRPGWKNSLSQWPYIRAQGKPYSNLKYFLVFWGHRVYLESFGKQRSVYTVQRMLRLREFNGEYYNFIN